VRLNRSQGLRRCPPSWFFRSNKAQAALFRSRSSLRSSGITGADNGLDVTQADSQLQVLDDGSRPGSILVTPRIGISKAMDMPLRFVVTGIIDDGIGIDEALVQKGRIGHWGLAGMRERAQKVGGRFNIWTSPGKGTEIDLKIPARLAFRRKLRPTLLGRLRRRGSRND
jgi:hypothetical protein